MKAILIALVIFFVAFVAADVSGDESEFSSSVESNSDEFSESDESVQEAFDADQEEEGDVAIARQTARNQDLQIVEDELSQNTPPSDKKYPQKPRRRCGFNPRNYVFSRRWGIVRRDILDRLNKGEDVPAKRILYICRRGGKTYGRRCTTKNGKILCQRKKLRMKLGRVNKKTGEIQDEWGFGGALNEYGPSKPSRPQPTPSRPSRPSSSSRGLFGRALNEYAPSDTDGRNRPFGGFFGKALNEYGPSKPSRPQPTPSRPSRPSRGSFWGSRGGYGGRVSGLSSDRVAALKQKVEQAKAAARARAIAAAARARGGFRGALNEYGNDDSSSQPTPSRPNNAPSRPSIWRRNSPYVEDEESEQESEQESEDIFDHDYEAFTRPFNCISCMPSPCNPGEMMTKGSCHECSKCVNPETYDGPKSDLRCPFFTTFQPTMMLCQPGQDLVYEMTKLSNGCMFRKSVCKKLPACPTVAPCKKVECAEDEDLLQPIAKNSKCTLCPTCVKKATKFTWN